MLGKCQSDLIENMQKLVVKLCFGAANAYDVICQEKDIEYLKARRETAVKKFVAKAMRNPRFAEKWFIRRPEI